MLWLNPGISQMQSWLSSVVAVLIILVALAMAITALMVIRAMARRPPAALQRHAAAAPRPATPEAHVHIDAAPSEENEEPQVGEQPPSPERRRFLMKLTGALGAAGAVIAGIPFIGFLFAPVQREEPPVWRPVGALDDFAIGETVQVTFLDPETLEWAGFATQTAAWLRRTGEQEFVAFSAYCTHVGCPVRWEAGAQMFMCPCHGGAFYQDGTVAAGPPPQPLVRYNTRVQNGQVEILPGPIPRADT